MENPKNALIMGCFGTQDGVKNRSKTRFSQSDARPFGMLKLMFLARFEPVVMRFGPLNIPISLKMGLLGTKMSKMCQKCKGFENLRLTPLLEGFIKQAMGIINADRSV